MSEVGGEGPGRESSQSIRGFLNNWGGHSDKRRSPTQVTQSHSTPPHHLEAERSVLGAILLQNESMDRVLEVGLTPSDFYKDSHRKIYEAASALNERREAVDMITLSAALKDRGWYEEVGGSATLTDLFNDAFAVGNVLHYARIIKDKAILRNMIDTCTGIIGEALDGVEDTEGFLDRAEANVFKVGDEVAQNATTPLSQILMQNMSSIEDLALKKSDVTGLATGYHQFDALTTGLHGGQLVVVASRPGMGKTSWFISAVQHVAVTQSNVVALYSLEMSKEEIGFRFLSGLSRIDSRRLKTGRLNDNEWQKLADAADRLSKSKIFVDDSGSLTVMDIRARCRRLKAMQKRLDLVVVDYLQLMRGTKASRNEGSREREISEISRNLKELSKELKVPIIALSQLNRGLEARQDKRPMLSDLRESGAIEQDADMVCFIYRDEYYSKEACENPGIAEFIVAKNRSGEPGTIKLAWIGQYTLFANLAREDGDRTIPPRPRPEKGDIIL